MILCDRRTDAQWARDSVERFPRSWRGRLLGEWRRGHRQDGPAANRSLLSRVRTLMDAERGGLPADASDLDICHRADLAVRDVIASMQLWAGIARKRRADDEFLERVQCFALRGLLRARGLLDCWPDAKDRPRRAILKRLQCVRFWRRVYRRLHARTVEACAIELGLVRRSAGLYCSDDTLRRCAAQDARNAAVLDQVIAVNDHGQDYTLAELAAKGTANKSIRRMELLTRIAGFEHIARQAGHLGYMVTMTCPSRFHPATTRGGRIVSNRKFDGSTPDEAQRYLSGQWAKCRAAAVRAGLEWYGFRIAEPQHDGTPHWHVLLFMPPTDKHGTPAAERLQGLVRRYFLDNESPMEAGAQAHRVRFDAIDWDKGSAVGYVIKYVSKNIDGEGVGLDLEGGDAIASSQRVGAWARTWRTRQFQQIGGAPVGVWRELRRLHPDNIDPDAPDALRQALAAVNVGKVEPGAQSLAWAKYTDAQGGIGTPRKLLRLKLLTEQTGELGRYGEALPKKSIGIESAGLQRFRNHIHDAAPDTPDFSRPVLYAVESERAEWLIGQGGRAQALAIAAWVFERSAAGASTRIHVNNCTDPSRVSAFAPRSIYRPKLRRWAQRDQTPPPGRPPGIQPSP